MEINLTFVLPMDKLEPITVKIEPDLRKHLEKQAKSAKTDFSKYVRACLKKASGFKEPPIV